MTLQDETLAALEAARARIRARTAEARRAADDAGRAADAVRTLTRTVSSEHGEVVVAARASGAIADVVFAPSALALGPAALSKLVRETIVRAQRRAALAAVDDVTAMVGDASPLVARLTAQISAQFGDTEAFDR